ncbi:MAG: hypothetical protein Q4E88_02315 [Coriobacteriia bacterium]|nr:hypothetical protein [Coriobacteriia bacterium]
MICPNCDSENVNVQVVDDKIKTSKKGVGLGGHANNAARGFTAVATLGMSNLVWKKSKGTNKSKIVKSKLAICQDCGYDWNPDDVVKQQKKVERNEKLKGLMNKGLDKLNEKL